MSTIKISDNVITGENDNIVLNNVTLSPDHPTIVYVPIDKNSKYDRTDEVLKSVLTIFQEKYESKYDVILMAVNI